MLLCCTKNEDQNTDGTPHNCYWDQQSDCTNCCSVVLTISHKVQTVQRTISVVTKASLLYLLHCCTSTKPTVQTVHITLNGYRRDQNGLCFRVNTETQTVLETFYRNTKLLLPNELNYVIICVKRFFMVCNWGIVKCPLFNHKLFPHSSPPSVLTVSALFNPLLLF